MDGQFFAGARRGAWSEHLTMRHYVETCHPAASSVRDVTHRLLILAQLLSSEVFHYVSQPALSSTALHTTAQLQTVTDRSFSVTLYSQ